MTFPTSLTTQLFSAYYLHWGDFLWQFYFLSFTLRCVMYQQESYRGGANCCLRLTQIVLIWLFLLDFCASKTGPTRMGKSIKVLNGFVLSALTWREQQKPAKKTPKDLNRVSSWYHVLAWGLHQVEERSEWRVWWFAASLQPGRGLYYTLTGRDGNAPSCFHNLCNRWSEYCSD